MFFIGVIRIKNLECKLKKAILQVNDSLSLSFPLVQWVEK